MILRDIILKVMVKNHSNITAVIKNKVNSYCIDNNMSKKYTTTCVRIQLKKLEKDKLVYRPNTVYKRQLDWMIV